MRKTSIKACIKHGKVKHSKRSDTKSCWRCNKCAGDAVAKRRRKLKTLAIEYKGGKCKLCNYNKSLWALTFHHRDPDNKNFGISASGLTRSWIRLKVELDKCELLCHNCHAEVHNGIVKL